MYVRANADSHDTRRTVWLRKNFTPGRYVLHCAMPMTSDAKSGEHQPTHADAGMVTAVFVSAAVHRRVPLTSTLPL